MAAEWLTSRGWLDERIAVTGEWARKPRGDPFAESAGGRLLLADAALTPHFSPSSCPSARRRSRMAGADPPGPNRVDAEPPRLHEQPGCPGWSSPRTVDREMRVATRPGRVRARRPPFEPTTSPHGPVHRRRGTQSISILWSPTTTANVWATSTGRSPRSPPSLAGSPRPRHLHWHPPVAPDPGQPGLEGGGSLRPSGGQRMTAPANRFHSAPDSMPMARLAAEPTVVTASAHARAPPIPRVPAGSGWAGGRCSSGAIQRR